MSDIYKLVQQKLAETRGGGNVFRDPLADIAMQIPSIIQANETRNNIKHNDTLSNITSLIDTVSTPEGFRNIEKALSGLEMETDNSDINMGISILRGVNKTSQQNYHTYKDSIDKGLEYIDSGSFPQKIEDYTSMGEIAKNANFIKEDGTGDIIHYLYAEKEKINSLRDRMSVGYSDGKKKYSYPGGVDTTVARKLSEHDKQIELAIQALAGDGVITAEEAYHIKSGDLQSYKADRKRNLDKAEKNISWNRSKMSSIDEYISKSSINNLSSSDLLGIGSQHGLDISQYLETNELGQTMITDQENIALSLSDIRQRYYDNMMKAQNTYENWAGSPYGDEIIYEDSPDEPGEESVEVGQNVPPGTYDPSGQIIAKPSGTSGAVVTGTGPTGTGTTTPSGTTGTTTPTGTTELKFLKTSKYPSGAISSLPEDEGVSTEDLISEYMDIDLEGRRKTGERGKLAQKEWRDVAGRMKETWGDEFFTKASAKYLNKIWELNNQKKQYPKRAEEIQKKIDKEISKFIDWKNKRGLSLKGREEPSIYFRRLSNRELNDYIRESGGFVPGRGRKTSEKMINAAIAEMERRRK